MRLLNTTTLDFEENIVNSHNKSRYAILSHRWAQGREVSFQNCKLAIRSRTDDLSHSEAAELKVIKSRSGYRKLRNFVEVAKSRGYKYCWIDTACINKESSAELQEAINSMWRINVVNMS